MLAPDAQVYMNLTPAERHPLPKRNGGGPELQFRNIVLPQKACPEEDVEQSVAWGVNSSWLISESFLQRFRRAGCLERSWEKGALYLMSLAVYPGVTTMSPAWRGSTCWHAPNSGLFTTFYRLEGKMTWIVSGIRSPWFIHQALLQYMEMKHSELQRNVLVEIECVGFE